MSTIAAAVSRSRASSEVKVSLTYLYLLRAAYLLLVVGLGSSVWPALLSHTSWPLTLSPWRGIGTSLIAALPLFALLGLRYPLKMLPLLLFEVTWKAIWLTAVALPLWSNHSVIDAETMQTIQACLMAVVFLFVIPWRYTFENFVLQRGDRWT